jgi:hypothetical protein
VIDTAAASVFEQHYFDRVDLDVFTNDASESLGDITWDTAWRPMPIEYSCTGNKSYRTIWWGDLRITFETGASSDVRLTAWSVGDPSVSSLAPLGPPPPTEMAATRFTTGEGIGVGASLAELETALGDRCYNASEGRVDVPCALVTSFLIDRDQRVSAVGSGRVDCIDDTGL